MDNTDPYKTKYKEERLYMSANQNLMQHMGCFLRSSQAWRCLVDQGGLL